VGLIHINIKSEQFNSNTNSIYSTHPLFQSKCNIIMIIPMGAKELYNQWRVCH